MSRVRYESGDRTMFYKISTFIEKSVSGGNPGNYAPGSCVRAFTWALREFPEKLRYAVDLRTTIKHSIINTTVRQRNFSVGRGQRNGA